MLSSLPANGDGRTEFQTQNCWKPPGHPGSGDLFAGGLQTVAVVVRSASVRGTFPGARQDWIKIKNPNSPAVKREAEKDWGR